MTYLVASEQPQEPAGAGFRALLQRPGILEMPGAHCGLAALQARDAGFEALYLSGAAMSASMGLPDLGILTLDEVCFYMRQVARAALPCGRRRYRLWRSAQRHAHGARLRGRRRRRGADRGPAAAEEMRPPQRQAAGQPATWPPRSPPPARRAVTSTSSRAPTPRPAKGWRAVARARLYVEAGADAIFPEALTPRCLRNSRSRVSGVPLLANMTEFGRTPFFTAAEFEAMGYRMVIWPVSSLRVANKAQENLYAAIRRDGGTRRCSTRCRRGPNSTRRSAA